MIFSTTVGFDRRGPPSVLTSPSNSEMGLLFLRPAFFGGSFSLTKAQQRGDLHTQARSDRPGFSACQASPTSLYWLVRSLGLAWHRFD